MAPTQLEQQLSRTLQRRESQSKLRRLKSSPLGSVDLSSNDFLSLATSQEFRQDYLKELQNQYLPIGSTGSRLLDGNSQYAESLERRIAAFHGAETGLLVGSGFDANVSIFTCLPQPGDIIIYDELIHASVHDGMRQSRATSFLPFKHNCLQDFRTVLARCKATSKSTTNIFIPVESVYSMDGDLVPLTGMVSTIEDLSLTGRAHVIVDEAHSTGIYGLRGRGLVSHLGLESNILVRLHTFGKALGCNGAIILCNPVIRSYLINYARPLIFTTFMSYPMLAAIKVAYDWLESGRTEELSSRLFHMIRHLHQRLQALAPLISRLPPSTMTLPATCPESAIFALTMSEPRQLAEYCQAKGFVVRAVVHPTVPIGTERVRICLHSGNTEKEIDDFVQWVKQWIETRLATTPDEIKNGKPPHETNPGGGRSQKLGEAVMAKL